MVQKLDDLPRSESKYFTKYKADTNQIVLKEPKKCEHSFNRISGTEVECQLCHIGFQLTPEFILKDKHIYREDLFII